MNRSTIWAAAAVNLVLAGGAAAQTDARGIWTAQVENDAVSTQRGTSDQYYTSGLRIGYTSGEGQVGETLHNLSAAIWGDGVQRISIDLSQSIFTPKKTQLNPPDPHDEPYAAQLILNAQLIHDRADSRSVIGLSLGDVGKAAGGQVIQNGFHSIIGDTPNRGWAHQLNDEPSVQLSVGRTYRFPLAQLGPVEIDTLPTGTLNGGSSYDYAQLGVSFRVGQGLASDFGTARIQPALSGTDAYTQVRPFAWYFQFGADGRAVAHNVFLDGNTFRQNSPHVGHVWDVGELQVGVGVIYRGVRISYSQTWRTTEFEGEKGGLFNFGSLALSTKF